VLLEFLDDGVWRDGVGDRHGDGELVDFVEHGVG
jgi:hypothetical protein